MREEPQCIAGFLLVCLLEHKHPGRRAMRILVYKRTHVADPDDSGIFGSQACMGRIRGYDSDAVIGVGSMVPWFGSEGIKGRISWIGIGPRKDWGEWAKSIDPRGPMVTFDTFRLWPGQEGPLTQIEAPHIARRLYETKARFMLSGLTKEEQREAELLLDIARGAGPSTGIAAIQHPDPTPPDICGSCPPRQLR